MGDETDVVPTAESDTAPSSDIKWRKRREDDEPSIDSIIEPDDPPSIIEINHLAYIGQQLNYINVNITNFKLVHNDLKTMNEHLWWVALSVKIAFIMTLFLIFIAIVALA